MPLRAAVSRLSAAAKTRCGGRAPHHDLISHPQSKQHVRRAGLAGGGGYSPSHSAAGVQDMLPFSPFWHTPAQCQVRLQHVSKYTGVTFIHNELYCGLFGSALRTANTCPFITWKDRKAFFGFHLLISNS